MTRVIKIGGRPQSDPALTMALAADWSTARLNGGLVLVHGGGDEISQLQSTFGTSTQFVDGRRVTSERDIDVVRMALSGTANKRLVSKLVGHGIDAVGISGEDAALIAAAPIDAATLGFVGVPTMINVTLLRHLLSGGYLPVVSPVSRDALGAMGTALNVNGDAAAAAIAVALKATELLLIADVEGVMRNGVAIQHLTLAAAAALIVDGTASGGMRAKLDAAMSALAAGVPRVRISDVSGIGDLTRGTVLHHSGGST